jgi:hypothetical protein
MTTAPTFMPATETRPYPLHMQGELAPDRQRLSDLAKELGYQVKDWPFLALEELARYRDAMHSYRQALVDLGELGELPVWAPLGVSL